MRPGGGGGGGGFCDISRQSDSTTIGKMEESALQIAALECEDIDNNINIETIDANDYDIPMQCHTHRERERERERFYRFWPAYTGIPAYLAGNANHCCSFKALQEGVLERGSHQGLCWFGPCYSSSAWCLCSTRWNPYRIPKSVASARESKQLPFIALTLSTHACAMSSLVSRYQKLCQPNVFTVGAANIIHI